MTKKSEKNPDRPAKKKPGLPGRLVTLALVLCVVLAVAAMTAMEGGGHMASLRRWLMYGDSSSTKDVYTCCTDR